MILYTTPLWNHLSFFDPLAGGLIGFFFNVILWFLFVYPFNRNLDHRIEKTFHLIIPPLFAGAIVSFMTGSPLFSGITAFLVYLLHTKFATNMKRKAFGIMVVQLIILFAMFAFFEGPMKMIIFVILIFKNMMVSQTTIDSFKNKKNRTL